MQVFMIGSGPAGLILGAALGSRGHHVISVDRDPGPTDAGWTRRGVMQFGHAHNFRQQVGELLSREWMAAYDAWERLGAVSIDQGRMKGVLSRRETLERALREAASQHPGLSLRTGHVDRLIVGGGRVKGLVVDGLAVDADLVIDASGRAGRVGPRVREERVADELGGDCGLAYVNRTYRLRKGAAPGPMNSPLGFIGELRGYQCLLFVHERGHFSVVLVRPTADPDLKLLHDMQAFEAACAAIPVLAEWTDPARAFSTSDVLVGAALRNVYRSQRTLPGLVTVGDAVATTTRREGAGLRWPACRSARCCACSTKEQIRSRRLVHSTRGAR